MNLMVRKLLETRIVTVAAPAYLRKRGRPFAPQELASEQHACIDFRDPETGRAYPWEFHRKRQRITVQTPERLLLNDAGILLSACLAGYGVAQIMLLGSEALLAEGRLVELSSDWPDEHFPLYALHPSRHHPPAKTRAFLDFVVALLAR